MIKESFAVKHMKHHVQQHYNVLGVWQEITELIGSDKYALARWAGTLQNLVARFNFYLVWEC